MSQKDFYFNANSDVVELDCLELSHSAFSQTYHIVRNAVQGVSVTHEDASTNAYTYVPMRASLEGPREDLDSILHVQLGDLGEIIPQEIDNVRAADAFAEFPKVAYRTYRSDDLSAPLLGPINLEIRTFNFTKSGAAFDAKAPSLNINQTGEQYTPERFPMLRGLL